MPASDSRAKVFISSGQRDPEMPIVRQIADLLRRAGFVPYIAREQSSLEGLKEEIFRQLKYCEYFLFIDFKREPLVVADKDCKIEFVHRGSLFSHQELAIASYLGIQAVGFQQEGVVKLDGMLQTWPFNCKPFTDDADLLKKVRQWIESKKWNPNWRVGICMDRDDPGDDLDPGDPPSIFHINVRNLNWRNPALDCRAYIEWVYDQQSEEEIGFRTFELKWAGTVVPNVTIMPKRSRRFDAFVICRKKPTHVCWPIKGAHSFSDTDKVWPKITRAGKYLITYLVTCFNFPPVRTMFELDLKENLAEATLHVVDHQVVDDENLDWIPGKAEDRS
jgi:hypothetical protein